MSSDIDRLRRQHEHFLAETHRAIYDAVGRAGESAKHHAEADATFHDGEGRGGHLRQSSRWFRLGSGNVVRLTNSKEYAAVIDRGGKGRWIRGKNGGLLTFKVKAGFWVSKREVWHPPTKAYRFLSNAWQVAYGELGQDLEASLEAITRRHAH